MSDMLQSKYVALHSGYMGVHLFLKIGLLDIILDLMSIGIGIAYIR